VSAQAQVVHLQRPQGGSQSEGVIIGGVLDMEGGWQAQLSAIEQTGLTPDDFSDPRWRIVWMVMRRLAENRKEVTAATVHSAAKLARLLGDADRDPLFAVQANNVLTPAQLYQCAEDHRTFCRSLAIAAELERNAREIRSGRFSAGKLSGILEGMVQGLARDWAPDETAEGDVLELAERWDHHEKHGTSPLLKTGIKLLDAEIGGLPPAVTIIAGRPGGGKTALLATMIEAQLSADPTFVGGLFGLEDGTSWLTRRHVAKGMGIKLRDVGHKARTQEEHNQFAEISARLFELQKRLHVFRRDTITVDEMVRRATRWVVEYGCRCIYIDHLGEVDHRGQFKWDQYWQAVAESVRRMRNFSIRHHIPVVVLCHTTDDETPLFGKKVEEGPPAMQAMAGGRTIDRRARLMLGLWAKGDAWRATVLKANELGAPGGTVEFCRLYDAALIDPDEGRKVDVRQERAIEAKERRAKDTDVKLLESLERSKKLAQLKAKEAAAAAPAAPAPPPPAPQASLALESPKPEEPKSES
jgi:replicative DNA helicase